MEPREAYKENIGKYTDKDLIFAKVFHEDRVQDINNEIESRKEKT